MTLKQILILSALGVVTVLLAIIGYKSMMLKKLAAKLLRATRDLELKDLQNKKKQLQEKVNEFDNERSDKAKRYRDALRKLRTKGK